jgi:hypothetical protein
VRTSLLGAKPLLGLLVAAFAIIRPAPAQAFSPYLVIPDPDVAEATPAYRYANMTDAEALAELDRRKILYTKLEGVPGVRAPVRLTGRLHGVYIHSSLPPDQRVTSPFEILDARLLLALDDFAAVLERHDIDEVIHFTMYRPNVAGASHGVEEKPQARAPAGRARASAGKTVAPRLAPGKALPEKPDGKAKAAKPAQTLGTKGTIDGTKGARAVAGRSQKPPEPLAEKPVLMVTQPAKKPATKRPGGPVAHRDPQVSGMQQTTWAPPGTRHPAGLAIDVGLVHKKDGRWLSVARQFEGHIGAKTCGDGAHVPDNPDARELRSLVCESADLGLFTYVLTPDYNAAHADHFHMEIKPGVRWFLYH